MALLFLFTLSLFPNLEAVHPATLNIYLSPECLLAWLFRKAKMIHVRKFGL